MAYKLKDEQPAQAEFGLLRARLAQRGISQAWIDANLGVTRQKPRTEHDFNMRDGYVINQVNEVFVERMVVHLITLGHTASQVAGVVTMDATPSITMADVWADEYPNHTGQDKQDLKAAFVEANI